MGLFDFFRKKNNQPSATPGNSPMPSSDPSEVAGKLESLGYFKYADAGDIESLKAEIGGGLAKENYLPFVDNGGEWAVSRDLRHYFMDGEDLFEEGGIVEMLQHMDGTFRKLNISLAISSHIEDYDKTKGGLSHRITINGQPYVLFDQFDGYGWGEAAQRFADMVNDQLALQGAEERLYLIGGGNDGRAVFLTESQQAFISAFIKDRNEKPLAVGEWCKIMSVERVLVKHRTVVDLFLEGLRGHLSEEDQLELSYAYGARYEQLKKLKKQFPDCPDALVYLLSRINGTYHQQYGPNRVSVLILGSDVSEYPYYLKSVEQILEEKWSESIREVYEDYIDEMPELIEGPIDLDVKIDRWLCFSDCMNNGGTSKLFIDFDPAAGGRKGQIIRFLHDPDSYKVIANSFDEYLDGLIKEGYSYIISED
jgi:hypothetical protein